MLDMLSGSVLVHRDDVTIETAVLVMLLNIVDNWLGVRSVAV